jgi:hypothetical protein
MTDADLSLTSALRDWRGAQLVSIGIPAGDAMYGSQIIMTDDILERLVELAHFTQLPNLASLKAQVNWRYSDLWGVQILELVKKHAPAPATDTIDQLVPAPHRPTLQSTGTENIPGLSTDHQYPGAQSSTSTPIPDTTDTKCYVSYWTYDYLLTLHICVAA